MLKIEKNKEYNIRLLPNFYDINKSVLTTKYARKIDNPIIIDLFMCYYLNDNIVDTLIYGRKINEFIGNFFRGAYITSDGFFICKKGLNETDDGHYLNEDFIPTRYFANDDKSKILFDWNNKNIDLSDQFSKSIYDKNDFKEYTDIVCLPPINLFDIQCPYNINLKTRDKFGFLDVYYIRLDIKEPLWTPNEPREKIVNLFDGVPNLSDIFNDYKNQMVIDCQDIIFDDEARKYYWDSKK